MIDAMDTDQRHFYQIQANLPVDKGAARKWMLGLTAALSAASYGVMWLLWLARIL